MEEDITNTIEEYFLNLPLEIEKRIQGNWGQVLSEQLNAHHVPNEHREQIEDEVFLNIAGIQTPNEICTEIKKILSSMDQQIVESLCSDLKEKMLVEEIPSTTTTKEGGSENKNSVPNNLPTEQSAASEEQGGVDIITQNKDVEEGAPLGRSSLIKRIENPEKIKRGEESTTEDSEVTFDPVASKLSGSTFGTDTEIKPDSPQYGSDDPYREPLN